MAQAIYEVLEGKKHISITTHQQQSQAASPRDTTLITRRAHYIWIRAIYLFLCHPKRPKHGWGEPAV